MPNTTPLQLPLIDGEAPMLVHLAAEYYPYARTGGLAEAAWGLHRDQHRRGLSTMAIVPLYRSAHAHLRNLEQVGEPYTLRFGNREEQFRLFRERNPASETPVCFIEHAGYFDRPGIYGERGADYPDNHLRYSAFAAAAVAALRRLTDGPVVLHSHDWHAALAPVYLRTWFRNDPWYARIPLVMSIHNGGYQGHFPAAVMPELGIDWKYFTHDHLEWYDKVNFLKGGLTFTDMATTVSPTHAVELRTAAGGFGLQEVYQWLGDRFTGVLNGIIAAEWNPAHDKYITSPYSSNTLDDKRANKAVTQRRFGLPENPFIPLVGHAGRIVTQKGLDLIVRNHALFQLSAQYVFLGSGEKRFEDDLAHLRAAMPHRIGVQATFDDELEHVLMAGSDIYMMPSQYEPCGLTQMRAQRYGTIPVARRVGGLADTIDDGVTGFLFDAYEDRALVGGMWRAMTEHRSARAWREMQQAAMSRDFSWDRVAEKYLDIYTKATARAMELR